MFLFIYFNVLIWFNILLFFGVFELFVEKKLKGFKWYWIVIRIIFCIVKYLLGDMVWMGVLVKNLLLWMYVRIGNGFFDLDVLIGV